MKVNVIKIEKPWGWEKWLEVNDQYVVKELFMMSGNSCSLQYHEKKHESFYVIKGQLSFEVGEDNHNLVTLILNAGDYYTIKPKIVHRMTALTDSLYIESSTNFLDDVIRLEDKYGRV
jgi:mannose-6-phosphate isomerase-like protein (cupin superfamily)